MAVYQASLLLAVRPAMSDPRPKKPILPRHQAGMVHLAEGTGPITAMLSLGDVLEIYKTDRTFHVRSPESVDPAETNPNAPWVTTTTGEVGSSNLIAARVLLQANEMLKAAIPSGQFDSEGVLKHLHVIKEELVTCELLAAPVISSVDETMARIAAEGIRRDNHGHGFNPFPQVSGLERACASFLVHINRAIKLVCELPTYFLTLERSDSNFDSLSKRLSQILGPGEPLTRIVRDSAGAVRHLIELRNFHEHPKKKRTIIRNFHVLPDGTIHAPTWSVVGEGEANAGAVALEMPAAITLVRDLAEFCFIHLLFGRLDPCFPYYLQEVPPAQIDPHLPIRYRISINLAVLRAQSQPSGGSESIEQPTDPV